MAIKRFVLILLVLVVIGGISYNFFEDSVFSEEVGDNSKLITSQDKDSGQVDVIYERDGKEFQSYFDPQLRDSLDWVKENVKDSVFLSWWDYGHMIRGYTGNDAVIYSPSEDILWSLSSGKWDENASGKFSSGEVVEDVAFALTSIGLNKTRGIMQEYGADYVFVTTRDIDSSFVLFRIAGLMDFLDGEYGVNDKADGTMLFRMIDKDEIEGFRLVYSDDVVRIFKIENI